MAPHIPVEDSTIRKYNAQRSARRCSPIDGLATAEGDDGRTVSMNTALRLQT